MKYAIRHCQRNLRTFGAAGFALLTVSLAAQAAWATPSTQIWIPSTDCQKFLTAHVNSDVYLRTRKEESGQRKSPILMLGPTFGVLPFEAVQAEVGFDLIYQSDQKLDEHPLYLHAKVGTPESSLFSWSPAVAVGIYNVGTRKKLTAQNIAYGLFARTLPVVGRLSLGYFKGSSTLLIDEAGEDASHGILASWDRTISELSDKLWLAIDYQGGASALGSVNFGAAWSFASNVSAILGYDKYLNPEVAGRDTVTFQIDINVN